MNQGKLEGEEEEMARVNIDISEISELKWTGMDEFNSDYHYIYYCGQESIRKNEVALIVNNRVQNTVRGCCVKNNRMISVSKANHSRSQQPKSMPRPVILKKLKLYGSMKTYKTL